jgi:hypothetical protein
MSGISWRISMTGDLGGSGLDYRMNDKSRYQGASRYQLQQFVWQSLPPLRIAPTRASWDQALACSLMVPGCDSYHADRVPTAFYREVVRMVTGVSSRIFQLLF